MKSILRYFYCNKPVRTMKKINYSTALVPPEEPPETACCGNGCENCVYTQYYEQLALYQQLMEEEKLKQQVNAPMSTTTATS